MSVTRSRERRRTRKLRVLRLVTTDIGTPRGPAGEASADDVRRAIRQWGGLAPLP